MHEGHFTEQIVSTILSLIESEGRGRPKKIRLSVGEVFHLKSDAVLLHYEMMAREKDLEGVELELEEEPVRVLCRRCRGTGPVEDHHLLMCPHCGSMDVDTVSGTQIQIKEMVF